MFNVASVITAWFFTFDGQNIYNTLSTITISFNASMTSTDYISSSTSPTMNLDQVNVNYYLGIYVLIGLLAALFGTLRSYYMFMGSLAASRKLHEAILDRVLKAKIRFFDTTPIGILFIN